MLQCRQGSSCTMQPTAVPKSQSHVQVHKLMKKSGIPSYGIRFPCDILFPGNPQRDAMIRWWLGTGLPWIRCKPCWFLVYGRSPAGITWGRKNLQNFRRRDPNPHNRVNATQPCRRLASVGNSNLIQAVHRRRWTVVGNLHLHSCSDACDAESRFLVSVQVGSGDSGVSGPTSASPRLAMLL